MRKMCSRLLRGVRSGYASVDAMRSLTVPLFILYDPYVDLWLIAQTYHGVGWVGASMSNVTEMHAIWVPWDLGMPRCIRRLTRLSNYRILVN